MIKILAMAVIGITLVTGNSAFAQAYGHGRDGGPHSERDYRGPQRDARRDERRDDHRDFARHARFHRGDRVPANYRNRYYVVNDWRGHHLRQPPRGHQWVQIGAEYVLMAVATGIAIDVVINH